MRYLLIASHVSGRGAGGMARYALEFARAAARRPDVELHVLASRPGTATFLEFLPDTQVHTLPQATTVGRSLSELTSARGFPRRGFDVVHGTKHVLPLVPTFRRSIARVLTVHDLLVFDRPKDYPVAKRAMLRVPFSAAIKRASVILADSRSTAGRLALAFPGVTERTTVVPLAVSPELLATEEEPVWGLAGKRFALVVGDASPRKNLQLVVDAWTSVRRHAPDAILAVVGPPGWGTDTRGAAFESLVTSGSIVPLGHVDDAELAWLYRNCTVTLCPSLVEGFGLPAAEAVAFGSALIRSTDPAMREAAGGLGVERRGDDQHGWVAAILQMFECPESTRRPQTARTWDEVVSESLAAVHDCPRS